MSNSFKLMSKREKKMTLNTFLNTFAATMGNVFVNVFLYTYTKSLVAMCIYTFIRISLYPFFYYLAGRLARKTNFGLTLTIGLFIILGQMLYILTANAYFTDNINLVYLAAVILGTGEGFYWYSVCNLNQYVSNDEGRNVYVSYLGIFSNIANIISPLISSFIIEESINDMQGYMTLFKLVIVIYIVMSINAFGLQVKSSKKKFTLKDKLFPKSDPKWKYAFRVTILYGLRNSLILTLSGLLVYDACSGSGALYGKLLTLFAIFSIITYYYLIKKMTRNRIMHWYKVGAFLIASSTIVLVLFPNIYGAIYFGISSYIATPMYENPVQIIILYINGSYENENISGRVIAKEAATSIGRCLGMAFIVIMYYFIPKYYLVIAVLILSCFSIVTYFYTKKHLDVINILKNTTNS